MTSPSVAAVLDRPVSTPASAQPSALSQTATGIAALVVNPSKFASEAHLTRFRTQVDTALAAHGWAPARWMPTTALTRGTDEARRAVAEGVDVVLVAGGDGTVRAVAQELVATGVPMGIVPVGTGNLLARNLGVPLRGVDAAVAIAVQGQNRSVDVGWLDVDYDGDGEYDEAFAFLVMAGAGFDAAIMDGADPSLKAHIGPGAYLLSAVRALGRRRADASLSADGAAVLRASTHGFVVGNCGSLTMGLQLMPDADPADGLLDTVVLLPQSFTDWVRLGWAVLTRRREAHRLMPRFRGRRVEYRPAEAQLVEVDGDVIGMARQVRARVQASALLVRAA